jgi:hypothetical protein
MFLDPALMVFLAFIEFFSVVLILFLDGLEIEFILSLSVEFPLFMEI